MECGLVEREEGEEVRGRKSCEKVVVAAPSVEGNRIWVWAMKARDAWGEGNRGRWVFGEGVVVGGGRGAVGAVVRRRRALLLWARWADYSL